MKYTLVNIEKDVYIYHIFFNHQSSDKHLGCFHNIGYMEQCCSEHGSTNISSRFWFRFLWIYSEMELLYLIVVLFLIFKGSSMLFSEWLHQFTFPPTVYEGFFFSTSSPILIICCFFDNSHSDRCEVISHCGFDLYFPDD